MNWMLGMRSGWREGDRCFQDKIRQCHSGLASGLMSCNEALIIVAMVAVNRLDYDVT